MKSTEAAQSECVEGLEAFQRFDLTMHELLKIPHSTLARRERAYRKMVDAPPNRRGPQRKARPDPTSQGARS
jgi:hypothetical protein